MAFIIRSDSTPGVVLVVKDYGTEYGGLNVCINNTLKGFCNIFGHHLWMQH